MKSRSFLFSFAFWSALVLAVSFPAETGRAQTHEDNFPGESYRLRVGNTQYGRVEISVDGGANYHLVGRVLHPATNPLPEKSVTAGTVIRSGKFGFAFSASPGQMFKLLPHIPREASNSTSRRTTRKSAPSPPFNPNAIVTNLAPGQTLFGYFAPPPGSLVRLEMGAHYLASFPDAYAPTEEDVLVFSVSLPPPPSALGSPASSEEQRLADWKETLRQRVEAWAQSYADSAVARARLEKRLVVSGFLTLKAKLPENEPDPIAGVSYSLEGNVIAAQNTPPFFHEWDTRTVKDGEYMVEIRAFNAKGDQLTHARALIVVHNAA